MANGIKSKLIDKETGMGLYPITANECVYDAETRKNMKEALAEKVEEAPKDDKQYARVNGTWAEVEAGAVSETALISLTPAGTGLNGATVKVTTNEGETLLDTTWQGAQLSVQVRAGLEYTVTVGDKDGYIAPEAVTYTAVKGATRTIAMAYTESKVTVNILSNQSNDTTISAVKATVKYGSTSVEVANGGSVNLPLGVSVTISFPAVTGYKKPDDITFTHSGGAYTKSGTYQTEIVTVTLSADNSASVSGQKVTINGTVHTWSGSAITQKVAFGTSYEVSVDDKSGYTTPASQSFTANSSSRTVTMVYKEVKLGVYIQDIYGKLWTADEWDGSATPNGIAVITENCSFVVTDMGKTVSSLWLNSQLLVPGATVAATEEEALLDFAGESNTAAIMAFDSGDTKASEVYAMTSPMGYACYLPAMGELQTIYDNIDEIETLFQLI